LVPWDRKDGTGLKDPIEVYSTTARVRSIELVAP
jgi:hypothetical protein